MPPESLPPSVPAGAEAVARAGESSGASPAEGATASSAGVSTPSGAGGPPSETAPEDSHAGSDPTTEDLLSTLPAAPRPRPAERALPPVSSASGAAASAAEPLPRETEEGPRSGAIAAGGGPYAIQVGAFGDSEAAGRRAEEARGVARGLPVEIRRQDGWLKVFVGRFATRAEGESVLRQLAARGLGAAWVTRVSR